MYALKVLLRKHHVKCKESYVSMVVVMMDLDQEPTYSSQQQILLLHSVSINNYYSIPLMLL